jgi:hypothetical protein
MDHDREPVLENHAALVPGALDSLTSEERYHLYKVLKLKVLVAKNADLKIEMAGTPMDGWVGYKCVHSGRHAYPGSHRAQPARSGTLPGQPLACTPPARAGDGVQAPMVY